MGCRTTTGARPRRLTAVGGERVELLADDHRRGGGGRADCRDLRQAVLVGGQPGPESLRIVAGELRGRDVGVELRDLLAADCAQRLLYGDAAHALRVLAHGQHERLGLGEHRLGDLDADVAAQDDRATGALGGVDALQRAEGASFVGCVEGVDLRLGGEDVRGGRRRLVGGDARLVGDVPNARDFGRERLLEARLALTACQVSVAGEEGDPGRIDLLLEEVPRGQVADLLAHLDLVGGHERLDELPGGIARDAGVVTDDRNAGVRRLAHERDRARVGDRRHDDRVDPAADERRHERRLARGVALRVLTDQVQALRRGADLDALADAAIEALCVEVERAHADALLAAAVTRPRSAARHGAKSQHGDQGGAEYESPDHRVHVDPSSLRSGWPRHVPRVARAQTYRMAIWA